jgi:WD40 repeat protein
MQIDKQQKPGPAEGRSYWCFISYRHADNGEPGRQWATWLHQAIETYEVPQDLIGAVNDRGDTIPERIFPVFRDEEELPVDADLASPIYRALDASKFLVVICSPRAVASPYVGSEIRYFKQLGYADRVLAVMIEGEPNASWDAGKQALGFAPNDECFPEAMRHKVGPDGALLSDQAEPIAADFRLGTAQGWTSPAALRQALRGKGGLSAKAIDAQVEDYRKRCELMKLKIIAGILGVPLGTLTERDKAYQLALAQKRAKTLRRWLVAVVALAVIAIAGGGVAIRQTRQAEAQRQKAVETLSQSDFLQGVQLIRQGRDSDALAYLARAVRANPQNHGAVARLYTLLISQRSWYLPAAKAIRHEGEVNHGDFGFSTTINSANFSPDGTRLLTASWDRTARLWDVRTGQPIGERMHHDGTVSAAVFSPDGMRVLTASYDQTARIWDAHTGQPIGKPMKHEDGLEFAAFSLDGKRIVTVAHDTALVWDADSGQPVGAPMRQDREIVSAAISPDGTRIVTASDDKTAHLWDANSGLPIGKPMVHDFQLSSATFSPDGTRVLTGAFDRTARLWDASTGEPVGEIMRHESTIDSARFSPDGTRIVTASFDHTARLWDGRTGRAIGEAMRHDGTVKSARFSADGLRVVTTSEDTTARVWDGHSGQPIGEPLRHNGVVRDAQFSPDGSLIATVSGDTVQLWEAHAGQSIGKALRHQAFVRFAAISPDGARAVTGSDDRTARLWDTGNGQPIGQTMNFLDSAGEDASTATRFSPDGAHVLTASGTAAQIWDGHTGQSTADAMRHKGLIHSARFSPDGARVVTASDDHTAQLWNASTCQPIGPTISPGFEVDSASVSPDERHMLTVTGERSQLWDLQTGQVVGQNMEHEETVNSASFSPDGTRVLTSSFDYTARLWDASTGQPFGAPLQHNDFIGSASFSPDGARVVTASGDSTALIWDARTTQPIGEPMRHESTIHAARFSPDGTRVITGSNDHTARVWDGLSGQPISDPLRHDDTVIAADFSPDGTFVITASADKTARIWDILPPGDATPPAWLADLAETVGREALSDSGSLVTSDADIFFRLKARLSGGPGRDFWSKAAAWFFADRQTRLVSPGSTITIPEYRAHGSPYLGVGLSTAPGNPAAPIGLTVASIVAGSPALNANLQAGDILTRFDGKPLDKTTVPDFIAMVSAKAVGTVVRVEFVRQGVKMSVDATIDAKP